MDVLHRLGWLQSVLLGVASAHAAVVPPQPPPSADTEIDEPLYAAPTQLDRIGRILAPVMVNGQGPFRFMLDTGANYSTISPELVRTLGLDPEAGEQRMLHGVTGSAPVRTVRIERLEAGSFVIENSLVPIVGTHMTANADGILGIAGLERARVYVDFKKDRVVISRSRVRREDERSSYLVIEGQRMKDGLFVVRASIQGVRCQAVIDTGAERTLGNLALRDAVRAKRSRHRLEPRETEVFGATLDVSPGEYEGGSTLYLGDVSITHVAVTYGDFHIFDTWKLHDRPALLVGMDVLGVAQALVFDFPQRRLLIKRDD